MLEFNLLQKMIIWIIPVVFAITLHEVAHGYVANHFGDPTAKFLGRLTLNPLNHIDLLGTIIIPASLYLLGGFIFGWAKPVPVDWRNLRNPRRDGALVALAGPFANLIMAVLWAIVIKAGILLHNSGVLSGDVLVAMGMIGVSINLLLMVLNLIPIPPLDGSRILSSFLSPRTSVRYNRIEPYGFLILLALMATGLLSNFMMPLVVSLQTLLIKYISLI